MRGQSLIDALMLVLALVALFVFLGLFTGQESLRAQGLRYDAAQHQGALLAVLGGVAVVKNSSGGAVLFTGKIADLMAYDACNGCPSNASLDYCPGLAASVNRTLQLFNAGQRHYILDATGTTQAGARIGLWNASNYSRVWDNRPAVCLNSIPVARMVLNTTCGTLLEVIYGTWPAWQEPPEQC
jgi:hypothetical protein